MGRASRMEEKCPVTLITQRGPSVLFSVMFAFSVSLLPPSQVGESIIGNYGFEEVSRQKPNLHRNDGANQGSS